MIFELNAASQPPNPYTADWHHPDVNLLGLVSFARQLGECAEDGPCARFANEACEVQVDKYLLVGFGNCVEGREDEYHDWYNNRYMDDVLAIPGFVKGQRFAVGDTKVAGDSKSPWRYLALFEIETDNLRGALDTLVARSGTDLMPSSDTVDLKSVATFIYRPITGKVEAKK
jgi:hypothetical protein